MLLSARTLILASFAVASGSGGSFEADVRPILTGTCAGCHNEKLASGGRNVGLFLDPASLTSKRDGWELILAKLQAGEMPPVGIPKPPTAKLDAFHRVRSERVRTR